MPRKIDPKIQPTPDTYKVLRGEGIMPEFVDWLLPRFVQYWLDRDDKPSRKSNWQAALRNWMRKGFHGSEGAEFERNKERICSNRNGRFKQDLFDDVLDRVQGNPPKPKKGIVYHRPKPQPIPQCEPMTAEQAFDALRKQGRIR